LPACGRQARTAKQAVAISRLEAVAFHSRETATAFSLAVKVLIIGDCHALLARSDG